jgi:catechol 2,3-dioxygenase-like lactoylglutathione lyase family enzyme
MGLIVTLAANDIDQSEFFYREILCLSVKRFTPQGSVHPVLMIHQGDATILLRQTEVLEATHPAAFQHLNRQARGIGTSLDLQIDNFNQVQRSIERHGITCIYESEDQQHNIHELWLYDPDNFLIILTQSTEVN